MYSEEEVLNAIQVLEELNIEDPELLRKIMNTRRVDTGLIRKLYEQLEDMHDNPDEYKNVIAKTRGNLLEELIKLITIKTNKFDLFDNITSDTNEYDIIIKPSKIAREILFNGLPEIILQPIICECKNYKTPVDVTWIGKFYSLLSISNLKLGIIFSYEGVTGQAENDWTNAWGLIRKIYLKDRIAIISISKLELKRIVEGESFCEIVEEKYIQLQTMTSIDNTKRYHPSEKKVQEILDKIEKEVENYKS